MTGPRQEFRVHPEALVHQDRLRWNAKYSGDFRPSFQPRLVALAALARPLPAGPVLDLASGPSGTALLAAVAGRDCVAVDVSDAGLELVAAEAARRRLSGRITLVQADLASWRPEPGRYALALCTEFWNAALFQAAARALRPGGMIGWEAFTLAARAGRPTLPPAWCMRPGEPASLLPAGFEVLATADLPDGRGEAAGRRRFLARRPRLGGLPGQDGQRLPMCPWGMLPTVLSQRIEPRSQTCRSTWTYTRSPAASPRTT